MITEDKVDDFIIISSENKIYSDKIVYFVESLCRQINLEETLKDLIYNDYYNFI